MRNILVHIHVPKCAGTSLNDLFRDKHRSNYVDTTSVYNEYQYDESQLKHIVDAYREMTCLSGHKLSLKLPKIKGVALKPFVVVRDPVRRFISWYTYNRKMPLYWLPEAKALSLSEFVDFVEERGLPQIQNGQCRFLTRGGSCESQVVFDLAFEHTARLVPLERLSAAVCQMQLDEPKLWESDRTVPFVNRSDTRLEVPDSVIERIRTMNLQDIELHDRVSAAATDWISTEAISLADSLSSTKKRGITLKRIRKTFVRFRNEIQGHQF